MEEITKKRLLFLYVILGIISFVIIFKLVELQIVKGSEYKDISEKRLVRSVPVKAPRGEIVDRYGRPMVTNRMGFSLVFQKEYIKKDQLNQLIIDVIHTLQQTGDVYTDTLPVSLHEPFTFTFEGDDEEQKEKSKQAFLKKESLNSDATPEQVIDHLMQKFDISGEYTTDEKRGVAGVRYEMEERQFTSGTPFTFATDISMQAVTVFKEKSAEYPGVMISVEPIREYVNGSEAAHILGRVGVISKEEYDAAKKDGKKYGLNDIVGKDGMEQYLEDNLRGKDGMSAVNTNIGGKTSNIIESKPAQPGNYAVLTIDSQLQQVLEKSLADTIHKVQGLKDARDASSGAAVAIDVNSGEILAMATYPTYDPAKFNEQYQSLMENPLKPMWNRAISGTYAPGSTFKMVTGIAGLDEHVITPKEAIVDEGIYKFYQDYQPHCWIFDDTGRTHGPQNVAQALMNSCNYYFYEVGRRLTIDKLDKYAQMFGLGSRTGIELNGEASGILASPEYKKKIKSMWYPGDTLQAAIGQSDNLFTPLQLANYVATLANGGTRYKPHLLKGIKSYESNDMILENQPTVEQKIDMEPEDYKAIMDGMLAVSQTGTAANVFNNYSIPVGSKTGTASVPKGTANGVFVAFAPFDHPQIAVAAVVEHGGHGNYLGQIALDTFDAYLKVSKVEDKIQPQNELVQ